jgi:hypothetical protein
LQALDPYRTTQGPLLTRKASVTSRDTARPSATREERLPRSTSQNGGEDSASDYSDRNLSQLFSKRQSSSLRKNQNFESCRMRTSWPSIHTIRAMVARETLCGASPKNPTRKLGGVFCLNLQPANKYRTVPPLAHFATPIEADGKLLIGTQNSVVIYGDLWVTTVIDSYLPSTVLVHNRNPA